MKKKFTTPTLRVIEIKKTDLICTSCSTDAHGTVCIDDFCDDNL